MDIKAAEWNILVKMKYEFPKQNQKNMTAYSFMIEYSKYTYCT